MARKRWTEADIADIRRGLAHMTVAEIAAAYGVRISAVRSALSKRKISVQRIRRRTKPLRACEGIRISRPRRGAVASYGAAALAELPDHACRWPFGDPADRNFTYCGARVDGSGPYCAGHHAIAYKGKISAELLLE